MTTFPYETPQVCTFCVMDYSIPDISFSEDGVCNYCSNFRQVSEQVDSGADIDLSARREALLSKVRRDGLGKEYDCIIGVSGGVDSSWALCKAVDSGLRPLAVHMDNGWNSELAQSNIFGLVDALGVDLHTHVIEWEEYRGLMQAFFDAGVVDLELLYDNAMLGVNFRAAADHSSRFILSGSNQATEGMRMPPGWNWYKYDKANIRDISSQHGGPELRTFPAIGTVEWLWMTRFRRIQWVPFLDYLGFSKHQAIKELTERFDFKPYPYKHYESIFTRFYQGYLLPKKWGIDKRKLHLSTLIASDQLSRQEALELLSQPPYPSDDQLLNDKEFFLKKMGWTESQLTDYLAADGKTHSEYRTEIRLHRALSRAWNAGRLRRPA